MNEPAERSPAQEPSIELTDLLVIYHQHLVEQSKLDSAGVAVETPLASAGSSIEESAAGDPELASELVELEDCLWQLELLRREEVGGASPTTQKLFAGPDPEDRRLGRFKIIRELGQGGLGVVFLAHDPILNRHVALKIPRHESLLTPDARQRFRREAQAAARLTHPHIVPVFEIGEAGPVYFITSAYVAGQSLADRLHQQPAPVEVMDAAAIVAPLAEAMHYAHQQGVLHRDLKPANILLEPVNEPLAGGAGIVGASSNPKITDFGLAKLIDLTGEHTRSGAIVGTPAYMSPEQAEGKLAQLGPATDVYSLGVILYELLLGRPPFRAESDAATLVQVVQGGAARLRQSRSEIPRDLEAICLKCLERNPEARYESAGELAADLRRFLRGEPTIARPLSARQRLGRWTTKNPVLAALSFTILALLLSVATVSTVAAVRIAAARDEARLIAMSEAAARARADQALAAEQTARRQAEAAEKRTADARKAADQQAQNATQISNMLLELFNTADPLGFAKLGFRTADEVGMDLPLSELLSRGANHARKTLIDQPLVQATLLDTLGSVYSNLGQLAEAEPLLEEAYALRRGNGASEADLATSELHIANLWRWQGKHNEAEELLRKVLAKREELLGPDHLAVAEVTLALAWLLSEQIVLRKNGVQEIDGIERTREVSATVELHQLIDRTLAIQLREYGPDHRDVGITKSVAALIKWGQGKSTEAQQLFVDVANIAAQYEGGEKFTLALVDMAQGTIARNTRDFDTAVVHYRQALAHLQDVVGQRHFVRVLLMGATAGTLRDAGRMVEAEQTIREAMALGLAAFPDGHPMFAEALGELAGIAESRGDYTEAAALIERSLEIAERFNVHLHEGEILRPIWLRVNAGQYADALELLQNESVSSIGTRVVRAHVAAEIGQPELASRQLRKMINHPEEFELSSEYRSELVLEMAEFVYEANPDDPEPIDLIRRFWKPETMGPSPINPKGANLNIAMSRILISKGRSAEVEQLLEGTLDKLRQKTTPENWVIGYTESVLGQLRAAQGRLPEAETLLLSGLANLRKSRGEHHRLTRQAAQALIVFYEKQNRTEDANQYQPLLELSKSAAIDLELLQP